MFDRYTDKARRVIFFARYECSTYGAPEIAPEHILLGLLRESRGILAPPRAREGAATSVHEQIAEQQRAFAGRPISISVDLPLSNESKRVLAFAAEEAERLVHRYIGTEHLLLGLLREPECFAAKLLAAEGLEATSLREEMRSGDGERRPPSLRLELPLSDESRNALNFAQDEAEALGERRVRTAHLLLGLLRTDIFAAKVLAERGLTAETLRDELRRNRDGGSDQQVAS